jgi:NADP-dependent 3-hydroxy acid dehydrogenase YdfG
VFINSSVIMRTRANVGQFAATQHSLKAIADSLREEVNPDQVRVLSVFPGRTASPRQAIIHEMEGKPYHPERLMQPEDVAGVVINALSLPRSAEVTDISLRPFATPM